jgi:hypothetical protein
MLAAFLLPCAGVVRRYAPSLPKRAWQQKCASIASF